MTALLLFSIFSAFGSVTPLELRPIKPLLRTAQRLPSLDSHTTASFPLRRSLTTARGDDAASPLPRTFLQTPKKALKGRRRIQNSASSPWETHPKPEGENEDWDDKLRERSIKGHVVRSLNTPRQDIRKGLKKDVYRALLRGILEYQQERQRIILQDTRGKDGRGVLKDWLVSLLDSPTPKILQEACRTLSGEGTLDSFVGRFRRQEESEGRTNLGALREGKGSGEPLEALGMMNVTGRKEARVRRHQGAEGLMYIPVGGTTQTQCPTAADAAGISLTQLAFLSICLTVFNLIVNVSNNINNNNNNNNVNADNSASSNNAQVSLNVNNGAQVNVMLPPPGRRRRKRGDFRDTWTHTQKQMLDDTALENILREVMKEKTKGEESFRNMHPTNTQIGYRSSFNILQEIFIKEEDRHKMSLENILQPIKNAHEKSFENILHNITKERKDASHDSFNILQETMKEQRIHNKSFGDNLQKTRKKEEDRRKYFSILQDSLKKTRKTVLTPSISILQDHKIKGPEGAFVTMNPLLLKKTQTRDPSRTENLTKKTSQGFDIKDSSLKDFGRILQERRGMALRLTRTFAKWMKMVLVSKSFWGS